MKDTSKKIYFKDEIKTIENKPTEKQINFIKDICDILGINVPDCKTKKEARDFISKHFEDFKAECAYLSAFSSKLKFD